MGLPFWQDRPTLVTGATGLVGSWLVRRLRQLGADIVCLIRDWVPQSELTLSGEMDQVKVVRGDLRDQDLLERCLGEYEIVTVMHLAAQTIVGVANLNPASTFETNIKGTWTLLEACRRIGSAKQIIIASSDKAYGEHEDLPYRETSPLHGMHPYDVSKSCADLIAQTYAKTYRMPLAITRCGNFFGGGDLNWNRIVPGTIRSVLRGHRPIIRSDGESIRDFLYVEDGATVFTLLAEQLDANSELAGQAFNFSYENRLSVLALVKQILALMGSPLEPEIKGETFQEIRRQFLSAEKVRRLMNWKPLFSMEQGLRKTINWYDFFLKDRGLNILDS